MRSVHEGLTKQGGVKRRISEIGGQGKDMRGKIVLDKKKMFPKRRSPGAEQEPRVPNPWPRMSMSAAQYKIVNLLKTL